MFSMVKPLLWAGRMLTAGLWILVNLPVTRFLWKCWGNDKQICHMLRKEERHVQFLFYFSVLLSLLQLLVQMSFWGFCFSSSHNFSKGNSVAVKDLINFHTPHPPGQNKLEIHLAAFPSNCFITPESQEFLCLPSWVVQSLWNGLCIQC